MKPLLTATITCVLAACVSYQSDTGPKTNSYQHVVPGQTTSGWLHQHLGPPDAIDRTSNGSEMWRYDDVRTEETEVSLFILFDFSNTSRHTESYYYEVLDGVVINSWRE